MAKCGNVDVETIQLQHLHARPESGLAQHAECMFGTCFVLHAPNVPTVSLQLVTEDVGAWLGAVEAVWQVDVLDVGKGRYYPSEGGDVGSTSLVGKFEEQN